MNPLPGTLSMLIAASLDDVHPALAQPVLALGVAIALACGSVLYLAGRRFGWRRSTVFAVLLAFAIPFFSLYVAGIYLGMAGGPAWRIGYYGERNRVQDVIARMADVRIIDRWAHEDVTLEDFGFTVVTSSGEVAKVNFMEGSPVRRLAKEQEIEAYVRASLLARH